MSRRIHVTVENDHLEAFARPGRSLVGVAELIWNALDAEADTVSVRVSQDTLGGVESVEVIDNGHGMSSKDAVSEFEHLGGSWKRRATHSKNHQRLLHGKHGRGRWRAYSIGTHVRWISVAETAGRRERTTITGTRSKLTEFEVSDPQPTDDPVGTRAIIQGVDPEPAAAILAEGAEDALTATLAPYLERYPNVKIEFRGLELNPRELQVDRAEYEIEAPTSEYGPAKLTVIEWSRNVPRELLLCDENGISLHAEPPGIQAPALISPRT